MQIYSHIHCYTKTGPVVWVFYKLNDSYVATNGEDTFTKATYAELKQLKATFMTYKTKSGGQRFYHGLPKGQATPRADKKPVGDPKSQLPLDLQADLWALPCVA